MSVKPFQIAHKSRAPLASIPVAANKEKAMINLIKRAFNCPTNEISVLMYNLQARETFLYTFSIINMNQANSEEMSATWKESKGQHHGWGENFQTKGALSFKLLTLDKMRLP